MVGSCGGSGGVEMMRGLVEKPQRCGAVGPMSQCLVTIDGKERKRKMDLVFTPFFISNRIRF